MIESGIMFFHGKIAIQSNQNIKEKTLNMVKSALTELSRRAVSKVVELDKSEKLRLGISSFKYRSSILAFAVFGKGVQPKILLDCSADLAETFVQNFSKLNFEEKSVKNSIAKEFQNIKMEYNKKINKNKKKIEEIDDHLKTGIDLSKKTIENLMEKGDILEDLEDRSGTLNRQAIHFENSGRRLKNDVLRQRMKIYIAFGIMVFLTLIVFFRRGSN